MTEKRDVGGTTQYSTRGQSKTNKQNRFLIPHTKAIFPLQYLQHCQYIITKATIASICTLKKSMTALRLIGFIS